MNVILALFFNRYAARYAQAGSREGAIVQVLVSGEA